MICSPNLQGNVELIAGSSRWYLFVELVGSEFKSLIKGRENNIFYHLLYTYVHVYIFNARATNYFSFCYFVIILTFYSIYGCSLSCLNLIILISKIMMK